MAICAGSRKIVVTSNAWTDEARAAAAAAEARRAKGGEKEEAVKAARAKGGPHSVAAWEASDKAKAATDGREGAAANRVAARAHLVAYDRAKEKGLTDIAGQHKQAWDTHSRLARRQEERFANKQFGGSIGHESAAKAAASEPSSPRVVGRKGKGTFNTGSRTVVANVTIGEAILLGTKQLDEETEKVRKRKGSKPPYPVAQPHDDAVPDPGPPP